jgi:hypothetical protein
LLVSTLATLVVTVILERVDYVFPDFTGRRAVFLLSDIGEANIGQRRAHGLIRKYGTDVNLTSPV